MKFYSNIGFSLFFLLITTTAYSYNKSLRPVTVELKNASGEKIGTALLTQTKKGVLLSIEVSKLSPGQHGIHFHEKGDCKGPDFKSAGGHFGAEGKEHGLDNPKGPHGGDLPNLVVKEDGTATAEMTTQRVTLKSGKNSLLKPGRASLIIHAKLDDQKTSPSGDSGDRIACGVIGLNQ